MKSKLQSTVNTLLEILYFTLILKITLFFALYGTQPDNMELYIMLLASFILLEKRIDKNAEIINTNIHHSISQNKTIRKTKPKTTTKNNVDEVK
jgi:hypothetical protein